VHCPILYQLVPLFPPSLSILLQFGYEDLRIKLDRGFDAKLATSRLNQAYEKPPDGLNTLFAKGERNKADLVDLKVYIASERVV